MSAIAASSAIFTGLCNGSRVTAVPRRMRVELGCGRGTAPLHYEGYAIPQEESRERFEEALDFILKAWTNDTFT